MYQRRSNTDTPTKDDGGHVGKILRFHLPLGLTAVLMATTFNIINASLARTPDPQTAFAAFALGQTVTNMFGSPVWISRQMLLAFNNHRGSIRSAVRVAWGLALLVFAWLALMAFTPLGFTIYVGVFGAPEALFPEIVGVIRVCLALPFTHLARAWAQAILMRQKRTELMTAAMVIRIVAMFALTLTLPQVGWLGSAALGSFIWMAGMAVEGISCIGFALPMRHRTFDETIRDQPAASEKECILFILPMILQGVLLNLTLPAINAGLARTLQPERNLAIFQVSWSVAFPFIAFIYNNISQTVLVLLESPKWWRALRRTTLWLSTLDSVALVLLVLSGGASLFLTQVIGIDPGLLPDVQRVVLILALTPFLGGVVELRMGIALRRRRTAMVGIGKTLDVFTLILLVFTLPLVFPGIGALAGPIAFAGGMLLNYVLLHRFISEPFLESTRWV